MNRFFNGCLLSVFQIAIVVNCLAIIYFWPRSGEEMLIVPILPHSAANSLTVAISHGAVLVGAGQLPGSFAINQASPRLAGPIAASGALLIATRGFACRGRTSGNYHGGA